MCWDLDFRLSYVIFDPHNLELESKYNMECNVQNIYYEGLELTITILSILDRSRIETEGYEL